VRPLIAIFALLFSTIAAAQPVETPISTAYLTSPAGYRTSALAASDGNDFLAVWSDTRTGRVRYTLIARDGTVRNPVGATLPAGSYLGNSVVGVFWTGRAYLLLLGAAGVGVAEIDRNGDLLDPPHQISSEHVWAAASSGSRTIVVVGAAILVLDDRGSVIESNPSQVTGYFGWTAASNGASFIAVATSYEGVQNWVTAVLLDADGRPQQTTRVKGSTTSLAAVAVAGGYRVFFDDAGGSATFAVINGVASGVTQLLAGRYNVAAIGINDDYLFTARSASPDVLTVLRANGSTVIDDHAFTAPAAAGTIATDATFATNGSDILFIWLQQGTQGTLFDVRGVILDSSGHAVSAVFPRCA
jgi:hypothetical protein